MVPVVRKTFVHLRLREHRQAGRGNALDALQEADYTCSQTMAHARPALLASSSTKSDTVLRERLAAICSLRYTGSLNRSFACTLRVPAGRPRVAPSTFITARYAFSNRTRSPGANGPVRLTLLTSQVVPRTKDGKQEDAARALRLDGKLQIPAEQSVGTASVVVPGDLPLVPYDLVVVAELLSGDATKQVVASAMTPSRRLRAVVPLALKLSGPDAMETSAGSAKPGKLLTPVIDLLVEDLSLQPFTLPDGEIGVLNR